MGGARHHLRRSVALASGPVAAGDPEPAAAGKLRAQALALCSALLLVSPAFIGHAAMHEGTLGALHRANHAVHLLAAGYWFGCPAPLLVCLRYLQPPQWRSDAITTLIRFALGHRRWRR